VPENMDDIHSMIWANRRISAKKTTQTLEISQECVAFIIHMFDIRKLCAKWAPKCLNEVEKHDRVVAASQEIYEHFRRTAAGLLAQLLTMYETRIHLHNPKTKEQPKEWRHRGSQVQKISGHVSQPPR
jgi:hypothetical protein